MLPAILYISTEFGGDPWAQADPRTAASLRVSDCGKVRVSDPWDSPIVVVKSKCVLGKKGDVQ